MCVHFTINCDYNYSWNIEHTICPFFSEQKLAANVLIPPIKQPGSSVDQPKAHVPVGGNQQQGSLATYAMGQVLQGGSNVCASIVPHGITGNMPSHAPLTIAISPPQLEQNQGNISSPSQGVPLQNIQLQPPAPSAPSAFQGQSSVGANIQAVGRVAPDIQNIQQVAMQQPGAANVIHQQQQPHDPQEKYYCWVIMHCSDGSRRDFIVDENDGDQVSFFCANADVSVGSTSSSVYDAPQRQLFPPHWSLKDIMSDTSSSLTSRNRSGCSAGSGGPRSQFTGPSGSR